MTTLKIRTMRNLEDALYRLECLGNLTPLQEKQRKDWDRELMAIRDELGFEDCV